MLKRLVVSRVEVMKNLKEKTFNTGIVKINFVEVPSVGPPLMLLHGGGDRWQNFLPLLPYLTLKSHIYALDLRGHGKSGRVPGQYRPEHYVSDIVAFLDRQVAEDVILFGHSLGGWIALMAAVEREEKVRGIILGDPPLCMERFLAIEGSEERISFWCRLRDLLRSNLSLSELVMGLADLPVSSTGKDATVRYGDIPGVDKVHLGEWAEILSQVDPDVAQYHAEGRIDEYVQQVNLDMMIKRITCPVLLIQADPACGGVITDDDVEHALAQLSDGQHVQLKGAGHDLGLNRGHVDPLQRVVTKYIESI